MHLSKEELILTAVFMLLGLTLICSHFGIGTSNGVDYETAFSQPSVWDVITFNAGTIWNLMTFSITDEMAVTGAAFFIGIIVWFLGFMGALGVIIVVRGN